MKRWLGVMFLVGYSLVAWADGCVTQTFTQGGKIVFCTTCCYGGQCHTTCR